MRLSRLASLTIGLVLSSGLALADDPTSRYVLLAPIPTSLSPSTSGAIVQFEVWDQASGGTQISSETHSVDTDANGTISNDTGFADLLLGRPGGLNASNYLPGQSRYLEVTQGGVSVLGARFPMYASVFSVAALGGTYANAVTFSNAGNSFTGNGNGLTNLNATSLTNGIRVQQNATSPNIINGFNGNRVLGPLLGATIGGGGLDADVNTVSANFGTVGGGANNTAAGISSTVAGGVGNTASGSYATVAGGISNTASSDFSFAAGNLAHADQTGCFVWGDASVFEPTTCGAANRFVARAAGGVIFYTAPNLSTGAQLAAGSGSWSSLSDRNVKEHFAVVDSRQVLARVAHLPIQTWNYRAQDAAIRHIGPMAQDFYAAFHVGEDEHHITDIDEGGVALAVQGLYELAREQQKLLQEQHAEIATLKARLDSLQQRR